MDQINPDRRGGRTHCVTGATGYIGSWLVKSLLEKGYCVHATVRNPANCDHFLKLWRGGDRLRLFKADLHEERSFDEAVQGCHGVFLVAASMDVVLPPPDDHDSLQSNVIDPLVKGAINILKSCLRSKSVKRVVFTSSISTMTALNNDGERLPVVDESCRIPIDAVWNTKASGWVYVLSKRLTEDASYQFAKQNNIHLVSVITTTVAGPFLTPAVPLSIRVLLSPITGNSDLLPILSAVNSRMGSIGLVHTEDVCNAHLYLMEHDQAEGSYICCSDSCTLSQLVQYLAKIFPSSNLHRVSGAEMGSVPSEISSKKLKDLGFRYMYGLQEVIHKTVDYSFDSGFLPTIKSKSTSNDALSTTYRQTF
ncbi:hypothetical protein LXL04_016400 [Taraxacum kok-saghyz]